MVYSHTYLNGTLIEIPTKIQNLNTDEDALDDEVLEDDEDGEEEEEQEAGTHLLILIRSPIPVAKCQVLVTEENWYRKFVVPMKGVVDGVADGTKTRTARLYQRTTINGQIYHETVVSSISVSLNLLQKKK